MEIDKLEAKHSDFYAPTFVVKVDGIDLMRQRELAVESVTVDLKVNGAGHFKFTVTNAFDWEHREFVAGEGSDRINLLELFKFGSEVTIAMGYGEPAKLMRLLEGTITELSTSFGSGNAPQLEVSGYDRLFPLTIGKTKSQWRNKTDSYAVDQIAAFHNLDRDIAETSPKKPVIEKNNETDLSFLTKLAERNSSIFYATNKTLYFGPRRQSRVAEIDLPWGQGLTSFSPEIKLANQIAAVEVYATSGEEGRAIVGRAENKAVDGREPGDKSGPEQLIEALGTRPVMRVRAGVNTQAEADERAENILKERAQQFLTGTAECIGIPDLRPNMNVRFGNLGTSFSKTYWVSGAVHEISSSGYTTSLTVQEPSL